MKQARVHVHEMHVTFVLINLDKPLALKMSNSASKIPHHMKAESAFFQYIIFFSYPLHLFLFSLYF